jgi:chemotaxis protein methyltransferase CheR
VSSLFSRSTSFQRELHASDEEFRQIRDHIYELCGIHIADNRKYLIENRLAARLKDLNLKTFGEYYYYLRYDKNRREELNKLYEVITTNETSFYRNPPQLKVFQEVVLKDMLDTLRAKRSRRLRIWSAGCSSGEEPYTLGIILHEVLKTEIASWDIKITASDISTAVLGAAKSGIYSDYALRTTPPEITRKYFKKDGREYHLADNVKKLVRFDQLNLNDKLQMKRIERSQIIFCRNVIIYFDDEMKTRVMSSFYDNLQPGGALLIGHSESLHNISRAFRPEHHKGAIVYRKDS